VLPGTENLESLLEDLELMSKEELLTFGNLVDTLFIEKELENHRSTPAREALQTRRCPGTLLSLEILKYLDGSTSIPYWFRYFFRGDCRTSERQLSVRYLGENLPEGEISSEW
jgi:hypothetical protein